MLPNIGTGEMLLIGAVALLLFGAGRIPEVARSLGRSLNAFKSGLKEGVGAEKDV
ncbi:MAG: twin-arginine translocase TatA/TatE family subunit [Elusimicrobia bacterium]|nr:twin-arginine translocase TatA/TatE family subunit [Elusimicrobiota bacterium]